MTGRKSELLDGVVDYASRFGLSDLSLRPVAARVGTSARLFIFHFGSKEGLVTDVLNEIHRRLRQSLLELMQAPQGTPRVAHIRAFWDWALQKNNLPYLKVLYELQMLAARNPRTYKKHLKQNSLGWLELVKSALPDGQQTVSSATLFCAVFDGLFLELLATGDRKRTTAAFDVFVTMATAFDTPQRRKSVSGSR